MSKPVCAACGGRLAGSAGPGAVCCAGCALTLRVPVDAQGQFPVNAALGWALGLGFVVFNQLLLWGFSAWLFARNPEDPTAVWFDWASYALAWLGWAVLLLVQRRVGVRGAGDAVVGLATAGVLIAGTASGSPGCMAAGNLCLAAWSLRGWMRFKRSEKRG